MTDTATSARNLRLFIRSPDSDVRAMNVAGPDPIIIGRDPSCRVALLSPEVSRQHARLDIDPRGVWLTDTSANGTLVDEQLVAQSTIAIEDGAQLQVGPYRIQVDVLEPSSVPGAAAVTEVSPAADGAPQTAKLAGDTSNVPVAVRREIHRRLLDHLDLVKLERSRMNDHLMRAKVRHALQEITAEVAGSLPVGRWSTRTRSTWSETAASNRASFASPTRSPRARSSSGSSCRWGGASTSPRPCSTRACATARASTR
jgi:pSer/pThr/pTyr-binding forkhead associated (FHA) protein